MKRRRHDNVVPHGEDIWPIRKVLTSSDVDITHPFLTLPRQPVEDHILGYLTLQEKEHLQSLNYVDLNVVDDSSDDIYVMKLKWRGSYYNLIGKWGKIVREKGLSMGNEIKMRWSNGLLQFSIPQQANQLVEDQIIVNNIQEWPIKKVLTFSDVDTSHPFLPLPRQSIEDHILPCLTPQDRENLRNDEQININAVDHDTGDMYVMKLKLRGNQYNITGKWGKIVRQKGIDAGREIKLRWANKCLYFSVPLPLNQNASVPEPLDQWPIRKALTLSDIDTNHPFLTLPGKAVEEHVLIHWTEQAQEQLRKEKLISVDARDVDTGDMYAMKLRWRGSYYNLIGKWGKIVREKELIVGEEIRVWWDNGCLLFSFSQ